MKDLKELLTHICEQPAYRSHESIFTTLLLDIYCLGWKEGKADTKTDQLTPKQRQEVGDILNELKSFSDRALYLIDWPPKP